MTPARPWSIELPVRLHSAANARGHWTKRHKRTRQQRGIAYASTVDMPRLRDGPLVVTLTRIAPRPLDGHDNLRAAFKATVDGIADRLGVPDNDTRITRQYDQERGAVGEYAIRIEVAVGKPA